MVEVLKVKWCADLEDLLQCPVCFERPEEPIYQCNEGHHICNVCRLRITVCPMCQSQYNGRRSYLAEHLSSKLDDIMLSLLQNPVEKKFETTSTQTEDEVDAENLEDKVTRPKNGKGKFPCRMGQCKFQDAHGRILSHLRYHHKDKLCEIPSEGKKEYSKQWELDHLSGMEIDLAFHIPEMGIFYLIVSIDSSGNLIGNVQIVNSSEVGREFIYKLELSGQNRAISYEGIVRSCRTPQDILFTNSLHVPAENMRRMVNNKNRINCTFTLRREIPKNGPSVKKPQQSSHEKPNTSAKSETH